MKRLNGFIKSAVAIILAAVLLSGCGGSSPLISEKVINSIMGAYQYGTDMLEQVKEEGWGSIAGIFKSSDEDEEESKGSDKTSSQASSQPEDDTSDDKTSEPSSENE